MEQLEIHSRSYLVRWVEVKAEHTISWSVQPHKKSINFGIFKHPGSGIAPAPRAPSSTFEAPPTPGLKHGDGKAADLHDGPSAAVEKLKSIGLSLVNWHGNCEANLVTRDTYDVGTTGAGMYALVFDNTFAKSLAKTVTFVLLTYPTNAAHQVRHASNAGVGSSMITAGRKASKTRPNLAPEHRASDDSIPALPSEVSPVPMDASNAMTESSAGPSFFTGVLQKRRRKRGQGYARRFFSLDYTSNTLSYYHNRRTLSIRGAVPLSLAAVGTNPATREISIDSGAEVWHLKALNSKDFENWVRALEIAAQTGPMEASTTTIPGLMRQSTSFVPRDLEEERDWQRVEELVSRISISRDRARRLARDMDPKYLPTTNFPSLSTGNLSGYASSSDAGSPSDVITPDEYFGSQERRSFWKRIPSGTKPSLLSSARKASPAGVPVPVAAGARRPSQPGLQKLIAEEGLHEQSLEMLRSLDAIITDFSTVIVESKRRRTTVPKLADPRLSIDSAGSQEFFDAEAGESQLLAIQPDSETEMSPERDAFATDEAGEASSASEIDGDEQSIMLKDSLPTLFPTRTKTLDLSHLPAITRRGSIPPPAQPPPSLIGFLRKNVGKDLSTVAMPVSANEPLSLLQKMEETLEYSSLLDAAASPSLSPSDRLLHVAAFAISSLSSSRIKERALRKPFNPMLGETYESLREDRGYRFLAEKVTHRPVRLAWHAESVRGWSLAQAPLPTQKFWGKSVELILDGRLRLRFDDGTRYSWTAPTCFLRNILAGEKYIEPVGTFTVHDESSGMHALISFAKTKGLFAGRSEGVSVQLFAASSPAPLPATLDGKWTESLAPSSHAAPLWSTGALVPDAPHCYGFTAFAASLNEVLPRDGPSLPPTDARRRPDQRAAEEGDLPAAESLKAQLENAQRVRRREMEQAGETYTAAWFVKVGDGDEGEEGEEVWRIRGGKDGYWECRARGDWRAARAVFDLEG